ncbi:hypothetical protein A0J61_05306 [Choanephora cucurbitarum]|uniref:Uncharacterized protein n=1 Tax=Choanephora cucurbitarum TaxID=101091 RepID=A0A1C7NGY2_9FUNG|nr:hypothetical protein A0J61_05306 [Choanephora cucurbitarum]
MTLRLNNDFVDILGITKNPLVQKQHLVSASCIYQFCSILINIPFIIILRRWQSRYFLASLMGIWGVASVSMGICTSYSSALVVRLISNACEVAFLPCALYYISTFYSRDRLALRLGVFWSFRYLADSIRDVLTYQVEDVDNRWNW